MRDRGFDRSPAMCTDKWRNLLKDYKKAKHHDKAGFAKISCYKDLEDLLRQRSKIPTSHRSPGKLDPYMQYSPKSTPCDNHYVQCSPKGHCKAALNLDRRTDPDGHSLALPSSDTIVEIGIQPWGWRDSMANGEDDNHNSNYGITIKICSHDESGQLMDASEEKTFYSDHEFHEFLRQRQWVGLRDVEGFCDVDSLDDLQPMRVYERLHPS